MTHIPLPAIWLIVLIGGLTQLSETVYSPSLPDIARDLSATDSMVEYTLTIYLLAFAVGSLFWGIVSDRLGRKPCILLGLFVFILGCIGCYFSNSIALLMVSRFVQGFGGSIGSVLAQAVVRDAFRGADLGRAYSLISGSLYIFPAIGPVIGGFIVECFSWSLIFIFLAGFALILSLLVVWRLSETHDVHNSSSFSIRDVAIQLLRTKSVIGFGIIVAACNGISFSYYAEGSFYLIELLGLAPSQYGVSFIPIALSAVFGGLVSKRLHETHQSKDIMSYGIMVILGGGIVFSSLVGAHMLVSLPKNVLIIIVIASQMVITCGSCMATSNALSLALVDYKWCVGTASSLFGFFYYCLISLFTFGMGFLHNDTLLPMPLYFLAISCLMLWIWKRFI